MSQHSLLSRSNIDERKEVIYTKTLVIYDSNYGNTQKIAECIAKELHAKAVSIADFATLPHIDLLIVGSPINGWQPTEKMRKFFATFMKDQLDGVTTATFDTRVQLFIHGDTAGKMAHALEKAGAINISTMGFIVEGTEGPLKEGEMERAKEWAHAIKELYYSDQSIPLTA